MGLIKRAHPKEFLGFIDNCFDLEQCQGTCKKELVGLFIHRPSSHDQGSREEEFLERVVDWTSEEGSCEKEFLGSRTGSSPNA